MESNGEGIYSCVDCGSTKCGKNKGGYPAFCLTEKLDPEIYAEAMHEYEKDKYHSYMVHASCTESEYYCEASRVEETIIFARKIGAKKIGIACCLGLIKEARIFAGILRDKGFEVYSVACKVGATPKVSIGLPEECENTGKNMCNPVLQAKLMNAAKTDLNIVMGLCVGHDSLFYRYSDAMVTTLVVKDRVTGHNPAATLYTADTYYRDKFKEL